MDPQLYRAVLENERVRVLEYQDHPGDRTHEHHDGDSVMVILSAFPRDITVDGATRTVEPCAHHVQWLPAQNHVGYNARTTETRVLSIERK